MRPRILVAGAVLTAVLALVALPGLAGSRTPRPERPVPAAALQELRIDATQDGSSPTIGRPDPALRSASYLAATDTLVEPAADAPPLPDRARVKVLVPARDWAYKPPRSTLAGTATWYGNGTTAMRLPRGTVVVICGRAGCIERTVTDWGPRRASRVIDMAPADFVRTCGCSLGTGTQHVSVRIY
ncbi:MAG TPA: hypothetical protein VIV06_07330 [Candidatus Limnocylindrales bacterium]